MLNHQLMLKCMDAGRIIWRRHALERMLQRDVSRDDVYKVIRNGVQIEDYPGDFPFPSGLFSDTLSLRLLHVVVALDEPEDYLYVISVYEPDSDHFELDMKTRRKPR